ncbi:hypothetical protein D0862_01929 [Hortaea werneckii]|uniref:Uncharacterized protein n=2 Tax=Hortaea werneckii TaxID=91943 RepID=A0A3M7HNI2_HORWE|nr:hypothetical protein D0862_01929 [Hortaea werneckii]
MTSATRLLTTSAQKNMAPIPIGLCGKSSGMASAFSQKLLPEYEIVHHFQSTTEVRNQLPALLKGQSIRPASGVGTNADSPSTQVPLAMVVGRGFSESELQEMRTLEEAHTLPWLYPDPLKSMASTLSGPFLLDAIAKRTKTCLGAHGVAEGKNVASEEKGKVWYF